MTVYFITRHPGARDWAADEGIAVDQVHTHFDVERVRPGDTVIGTLPVHLAARVCTHGGRYLHLSLEIPPAERGAELSAEAMRRCGARLEEYFITRRGAR